MKLAILSINIGEYICFWPGFYQSCQENFLPDIEKTYFLYTDKKDMALGENVTLIYQEDLGWPYNTMKRFSMFERIADRLADYDYIFFLNANTLVNKKIDISLFHQNKDIYVIEHPGFHCKQIEDTPWEDRPESNAYVPMDERKIYVQGAFIGGKATAFLDMVHFLNKKTEEDLSKGIVAIWHDESFLNRYIVGRQDVQVMGWQYIYYEEVIYPFEPVFMLRNKQKYISKENGRFKGRRSWKLSFLAVLRNAKWWLLIKVGIYKWQDYYRDGAYVDADVMGKVKLR